MQIDHWIAFVAASGILLIIPGPTVLLVVSYALGHGRRSAVATVAGVAFGDFTAMTASMLGLGALLAASAALFSILKWIGAAYLIYLGIRLWRAPVVDETGAGQAGAESRADGAGADAVARGQSWRILAHAYVVTALNPKSVIFFIAFVPQFLDAARPPLPQMAILVATFVVLASINALAYALMASAARSSIRKPAMQRAVNRTGGSLLIGAGALAILWRPASA